MNEPGRYWAEWKREAHQLAEQLRAAGFKVEHADLKWRDEALRLRELKRTLLMGGGLETAAQTTSCDCGAGPDDYCGARANAPVEGKPSNPKDAAAESRPNPMLPLTPFLEATLKLLEGRLKYGANNWTVVGVRASVYVGAAGRHTLRWWFGEEYETLTDPKTGEQMRGVHHLAGAIASLSILRDAQWRDKLTDDRPPRLPRMGELFAEVESTIKSLVRAFGHNTPKHYTIEDSQ